MARSQITIKRYAWWEICVLFYMAYVSGLWLLVLDICWNCFVGIVLLKLRYLKRLLDLFILPLWKGDVNISLCLYFIGNITH